MSIRFRILSNYDICQSHDLIDLIGPLKHLKKNPRWYGCEVLKKLGLNI